jgi:hypothetical protein
MPGFLQATASSHLSAEWSPELNAKVLEIAQTKVAMPGTYFSEMEQTASDETYQQLHRRSFGSRPSAFSPPEITVSAT